MKKNKQADRDSLRQQLGKILEVPPEVISDYPKIVMLGNHEVTIENFMGLIEYTMQKVRVSTKCGILVIDGIKLEASRMTAEQLIIKGTILQISFVI